jgi:hypothetical protein
MSCGQAEQPVGGRLNIRLGYAGAKNGPNLLAQ